MTQAAPIRTTCPYCGVGCGVLATPDGRGGLAISGDPHHPANFGRLCSKGLALGETLGLEGRLLAPRIAGIEADWDTALDLVATKFTAAITEHGPDSVAFYVSGQMLTEDYYVANKLMKGYIGTANIDTNSRLCMASSVAGHRRAFGSDTVPGQYEDLELADLVVLVGSNLAWCHPVLYQRLAAAKAARPRLRVVNIDPRRTATCDLADLHLAIAPGADAALFNGLLVEIAAEGVVDRAFVAAHVTGFDAALAAAHQGSIGTGLPARDLAAFHHLWIGAEKVVTVYSQGINQSATGTDKVNAILNCHLATGRIGKPGMGPFSVTGQPNAMGGREVGGLANMLACHLELDNPAHRDAVQGFWGAPALADKPGLKAVDLFQAAGDGRIRALWIIGTNPAVSMPDAGAVADAIRACPFVVVSDIMADTDTTRLADVLLPATGWGEKNGTVTNSERRISRQRAALPSPGQARDDWRILAQVATRMGWADAFAWPDAAAVFAEHAALSGVAATAGSDFDISAHAGLTTRTYDALQPFVWPQSARRSGGRFFGDGRFHTKDGRARMVPIMPAAPQPLTADHPLRLNTGRIRDHWHTMTRTGLSPRLNKHIAEPFVEVHPVDAERLGLAPATLAHVHNAQGSVLLRVLVTPRVQPGQVFAPMHWSAETAPQGRINALVAAVTDPQSGQPEMKTAAVSALPFAAAWYGFAVSTRRPAPCSAYHAVARTQTGWRAELADGQVPDDWQDYARGLLGHPGTCAMVVHDRAQGLARVALLQDGHVVAALFTARGPVAVARDHVAALLGTASAAAVLAGRPGIGQPDPGAVVCACFGVGVNTILGAIHAGSLNSVDQIGQAVRAGTNCGSCRPELRSLLASRVQLKAAE